MIIPTLSLLNLWLTSLPKQDWSERVSFGNMDGYRSKFEKIQSYFAPRFPEATRVGNEMIKTIEESLRQRKGEDSTWEESKGQGKKEENGKTRCVKVQ